MSCPVYELGEWGKGSPSPLGWTGSVSNCTPFVFMGFYSSLSPFIANTTSSSISILIVVVAVIFNFVSIIKLFLFNP